jgi:hypothetical protein
MKLWSEDQIVQSLVAAGFSEGNVQSFWRSHSFVAFIALRGTRATLWLLGNPAWFAR